MIHFQFKRDKEVINWSCPESWGELSWRQWSEIQSWAKKVMTDNNVEDLIQLLVIVSGIGEDVWLESAVDYDLTILPHLLWFNKEPDFPIYDKSDFVYEGKNYPMPPDIQLKTLGQKRDLQKEMQTSYDKTNDFLEAAPMAVAIYLQPDIVPNKEIKSGYDLEAAKGLCEKFKDLPMNQIYPAATFFLGKSLPLMNLNLSIQ